MKTKAEIVQHLLEAGHINAEDAVILLTGSKEKEYVYIPQPYPVYPTYPNWYSTATPVYIPNVGITVGTACPA